MTSPSPHPASRPSAGSRSLLARLHREWHVLAHRPAVIRRAQDWGLGISFTNLDEVVAATGFWSHRDDRLAGHPSARAEVSVAGDRVLLRLLVAARSDELAARVVLQRLLPGLTTRARRWTRGPGGSPEALDELVSAAWSVIRTFPLAGRTSHLAARLLRDAEYHAFVRATRRQAVHQPTEPRLLDRADTTAVEPDPLDELDELVTWALARSLPDRDLQLLRLLVRGCSVPEVAAELEISVRSVANHRDAMVHRLRQAARSVAAA